MADEKNLTDYELIELCLKGDNHCFSELVSRYKSLVYSTVLRMTNDREEANDLAQEIFIKVYKNLDKYYPKFKFSTWIIRICTNHVIDYRRKKKLEYVPLEEIDFQIQAPAEAVPENEYLKKEQAKYLYKIIDELPEMYKIPIVLYHQQGFSYQEIADIIKEPLSKVKNRIFRGRKMLKDTLILMKGAGGYEL